MEGKKEVRLQTRNEERVLTVVWAIDNFSLCCFKHKIESENFPDNYEGTKRFRLVLYPEGIRKRSKEYIGIFLKSEMEINVFVEFTISILNSDMEKVIERSAERILTAENPDWGYKEFYKRSELFDKEKNILKNDTLVFQLRMKWLADETEPELRNILEFVGETKQVIRNSYKASSLSVEWFIDYSSLKLKQPGDYLQSQRISVDSKELDSLCIQIYPKGQTESTEQHVSILLKPTMKCEVTVRYTVTLLNSDKEKVSEKTKTGILKTNSPDWGFSEFCKTSDLLGTDNDNIKRGTMLLKLDIKVLLSEASSSSMVVVEKHDSETTFLPSHLGDLLSNPELVRLQVGDRDFHVHKSVLTTRSPVFKAMFEADMSEAASNSVTIDDVEPGIMVEVLGYIYTGRFPATDEELAERILPVADRYELEGLKKWCCQELESGLSVVNAISTLLLADRHSLEDLKDKSISFLVDKAKDVHSTEAWGQFNTSHPQLANQVYASMLEELLPTKTVR